MIILGIDPGTATTGWGVIKKTKGFLKALDYGCITTDKKNDQAKRLLKIHQALKKIIKKYNPLLIAVENIFFFKNLKTAIKVSEARGVILLTAENLNKKIKECTPLEVKIAVVGYGRAEKRQVQKMVKVILKLKEIPAPDDAADALAVAICAANRNTQKLNSKF